MLQVAEAMGEDSRIGRKFLEPGPGYGGSCFSKDNKTFVNMGKDYDCEMLYGKTTIEVNERQKEMMFLKIKQTFDKLRGKVIAILGLTFKSETDDIRDAVSVYLINKLNFRMRKTLVFPLKK